MAIQQIDLAVPNGDTVRSANVKINENFSNPDHAASRLVGEDTGNVMEVGAFGLGRHAGVGGFWSTSSELTKNSGVWTAGVSTIDRPSFFPNGLNSGRTNHLSFGVSSYPAGFIGQLGGRLAYYMVSSAVELTPEDIHIIYTSGNTNKGTNGVLSAKSPVTHLYHDRVEHTGNEKELQPIEFIKQGIGDYLLRNTTGLAQEGWYIVIPHDANGNPLIAVEYDDNGGDVNVRTYKRKFDYEQAKVVADHDNPMDIPETRWIDLRFNDDPSLYDEVADEPIE